MKTTILFLLALVSISSAQLLPNAAHQVALLNRGTSVGVTPTILITNTYAATTLRSDVTGALGMGWTNGASGVTVTHLARWVVSGNSQSHTVYLVNFTDKTSLGSVTVTTTGEPVGYKYVALASPISVSANQVVIILSTETNGGDQWYDNRTSTPFPTPTFGLWGNAYYDVVESAPPFNNATLAPNSDIPYIPVNLKYTIP